MRSSLGATPAWRAICRCERPPAVGAMSSAIGLASFEQHNPNPLGDLRSACHAYQEQHE